MKAILSFFIALILPSVATSTTTIVNKKIFLSVPFTSEIPLGKWIKPWNNACEEAVITMIDQFYRGTSTPRLTRERAVTLMQPIFLWEDKHFGYNADANAAEIARIVNETTRFTAVVKRRPTLEDIKHELEEGHPVISLHYGFGLKNPLIPFRRSGSSYHTMVIKGYDDDKQEFIVNDPGNDKSGLDFRYSYATIMDTLHDFNHQTKKADGEPVVIFTAKKVAAKS